MSSSASPPDAAQLITSFWRDVGDAVSGRQYDYTREPLNRAILLLAVPMILEMLAESLFAIVDVFWVSRLGRDAIAVVGLTEAVMSLIYAVAVGIAIAASAIVSRRVGEKDYERASRSAAQIVLLGLGASALLGLVLGYFSVDILELMGASPAVIELGAEYARLMFGANVTVFLIFIINAIFRGAGDAALAMRTLWLANALNIVLAPCFIYGWGFFPELGVTGAAVATNIGRGLALIYQLSRLSGRRCRTRVRLRHFKPQMGTLSLIIRIAANGIVQIFISTSSWIALFKVLATFGSAVVAGYTITLRVVFFILLPAWGLASAAATIVGQSLGAQQPERAEAAVKVAARLNILLLTGAGIVLYVAAGSIVRLFTDDIEIVMPAMNSLRIVSIAFPLYAVGICFGAAFNGAGDTWTPTLTSFFCLWLCQVPLAWALSHVLKLGPLGVFIAVPASISALALANYILFTRGQWKLRTM